jgi:hypothetical protein
LAAFVLDGSRREAPALAKANFSRFFMLDRSLALGLRNRTVGCLG